jgi:predicted nuclease with TOPRIM domain
VSPVELTAISAVVISLTTSLLVPWLLRRRAAARASSDTNVVSWQSITAVLQKERDTLREQLDTDQGVTRRTIRQLDEEYSAQLFTARRRITQLESEVATLYERLRRYGDEAVEPIPNLPSLTDPPEQPSP